MKRTNAVLLIVALLSAGCATTGQGTGEVTGIGNAHPLKTWIAEYHRARRLAVVGALFGAATGAAAAAATGHKAWEGALGGAIVGGAIGFAIGHDQDRVFAGRDVAVQETGYSSAQGYLIHVDQIRFEPEKASPGQTATLFVRYTVIGPDPTEDIVVNCFKGIRYESKYVMGEGPAAFTIRHGGAIVETSATIAIPAQVPAGSYTVETLLDDVHGRFQATADTPAYIG